MKEVFAESRGTLRDVQGFSTTQGKLPSIYIDINDELSNKQRAPFFFSMRATPKEIA